MCAKSFTNLLSLCQLQAQTRLAKPFKDQPDTTEMLFEGVSEHDHIVKIHQALRPLQTSKDEIHQPLEGGRSIAQTKGHYPELKEPFTSAEGCLSAVGLADFDLPIAA